MFDGTSKAKSNISLGGRREKKDTKSILEQSRLQREQRAKERLSQASSTTLQRVWRGSWARHMLFSQHKSEFDKKCSDVDGVQSVFAKLRGTSSAQSFKVPGESIRMLMRNFCFFSREKPRHQNRPENNHAARLRMLLSLLCQSTVDEILGANDNVARRQLVKITISSLRLVNTCVSSGDQGIANTELMSTISGVLAMLIGARARADAHTELSLYEAVCQLFRTMVENNTDYGSRTTAALAAGAQDSLLSSLCLYMAFYQEHASGGGGTGLTVAHLSLVEHVLSIPNVFLVAIKTPTMVQFRASLGKLLVALRDTGGCGGWEALFECCSADVLRATVADGGMGALHALCNLVLIIQYGDTLDSGVVLDPSIYRPPLSSFLCGDPAASVASGLFFQALWKILVRAENEGVAIVPVSHVLGSHAPTDGLVAQYDDLPPTDCNKKLDLLIEGGKKRNSSSCGFVGPALDTIRYVLCYIVHNGRFSGELLRQSLDDLAVSGTAQTHSREKALYAISVYSRLVLSLPSQSPVYTKAINQLRIVFRGVGSTVAVGHLPLQQSMPHQLFVAVKLATAGNPADLLAAASYLQQDGTVFDMENVGGGFPQHKPALCDDIFRMFCAIFSYELLFADDADIFASRDASLGTANSPLMAEDDTRLLIATLREALFRWCWAASDSPSTGRIPLVQRLLIGLVSKLPSNSNTDEESCAGELLLAFRCLHDCSEPHMQPRNLAAYGKVHAVIKLFNQLYDRYCRFYRRSNQSDVAHETVWLWANTYHVDPTGATVVAPVLPAPLSVTGGNTFMSGAVSEDLRLLNASDAGTSGTDDSDLVAYSTGYGPLISAATNSEGIVSTAGKVSFAAACLMKAILIMLPQVIPFKRRVSVFECLLKHDRIADMRSQGGSGNRALDLMMSMMDNSFHSGPGISLQVRRSDVLEDSFAAIEHNPTNRNRIKNRMQVAFVSGDGHMETGIDGGGLFKEFIDLFLKTAFEPEARLFLPTTEQWLVPNPLSHSECCLRVPPGSSTADQRPDLRFFQLVGKVLGKAVYERILVDSQLSVTVLNALLAKSNQFDDLVYFDVQLLKSLKELRRYASDEDGEAIVDSLGLTFEAAVGVGTANQVELVPGGAALAVSKDNVISYIYKLANYKLNEESKDQMRALVHGFREVICKHWVLMFSPAEMQMLIGGEFRAVDVEDMQKHCNYGGGYHPSQPYIQAFWKIVAEMSMEDQANLLRFVTSCARQPLLGFRQLNPLFCVQKIPTHEQDSIDEFNRREASATGLPYAKYVNPPKLPTAGTCMNLLKLPEYSTVEMLREKLLYAIRSQSGFELT